MVLQAAAGPARVPAHALQEVVVEVAVEPLQMDGVHGVLHALKPVAGQGGDADGAQDVVPHQEVPAGQQGHGFRAQVGEDEAAKLLDGVGDDANAILERAVRCLGGRFQALPGVVEEPAVVRAPEAALLRDAVEEIDAAVRAGLLDEAQVAPAVPVQDQVFAEEPHGLRGLPVELRASGDGVPVPAHERAHRGAGPHAGQPLVVLKAEHWHLLC